MSAVLAASVVASRLKCLDLESLGVPLEPRRRHRAPSLRVGTLLASATRPTALHVFELAVLKGAVGGSLLTRSKGRT